ncbi:WAT1-related protein, partial [Drosera capensis]
MEEGRYWLKETLPFSMMLALECTNVGLNTIFKAATNKGMSHYVFIFYSYGLAAIVLLPSPLLYRKAGLPQLTFSIAAKLFLLGSIGCTAVMLGYKGINDSNPTLASAMSNLIPAFTFI